MKGLLVLIYILFCLLVAFAGRKTKGGFFGALILSILITPLLTAILVVIFTPKKKKEA